ncbi:MAG: Hpt domain-containing protein [Sphingomonas fennica]
MTVVNETTLARLRAETGASFDRILGYYREDGAASLIAIEQAVRRHDAVAIVRPAHTLKGESLQFGAEPLAALAAEIERGARQAVEDHSGPDDLIAAVVRLRPLFSETLHRLEALCAPLPAPPPPAAGLPHNVVPITARRAPGGFGRRASGFGNA